MQPTGCIPPVVFSPSPLSGTIQKHWCPIKVQGRQATPRKGKKHSDQGRAERSEATPWFTQTFILVAPKEKKHYEIRAYQMFLSCKTLQAMQPKEQGFLSPGNGLAPPFSRFSIRFLSSKKAFTPSHEGFFRLIFSGFECEGLDFQVFTTHGSFLSPTT